MYNSYIIVLTIALLYLLYRVYITLNGRIRVLSITSFFCICYIVYALIGSTLLNCMKFTAEDNTGIYSHPEILLDVWIYTCIGFIFLFAGFTFAHIVFQRSYNDTSVKKIYKFFSTNNIVVSPYDMSRLNYKRLTFLFLIGLATLLIYRSAIGSFPLESIFLGLKRSDLALLRSDATNNFSGKMYRYEMFMHRIPLFLLIITSFIREGIVKKKWKILYVFLLIYNIVFALITLQKAPIINLIILLYIIHVFKEQYINKRILIVAGCVSLVLIILMYIFFMGVSDEVPKSEILAGAFHRIFISSIMPFYWYIKYTDQFGLLYGTSFPNPGGILPFEHFRISVEIMNYAHETGDVVGSMPVVFIGEFYANFGFWGIIAIAFFVGFLLQWLDIIFWNKMAQKKTVIICSLYFFLIIFFADYAQTSISGIIIDTNLYIILFLAYIYYRCEKLYMKRHHS